MPVSSKLDDIFSLKEEQRTALTFFFSTPQSIAAPLAGSDKGLMGPVGGAEPLTSSTGLTGLL